MARDGRHRPRLRRPGAGRRMGVATTAEGVDGLLSMPEFADIAHRLRRHLGRRAPRTTRPSCDRTGMRVIDLTPAAIGPYVRARRSTSTSTSTRPTSTWSPAAARPRSRWSPRSAVSTRVAYAEIVASIASKSAGPGTRANIDEFTETTPGRIEAVGGAARGKAIIILNPAEPPLIMRDTVFCLVDGDGDHDAIEPASVAAWSTRCARTCRATGSSSRSSSSRISRRTRCTSPRPARSAAPEVTVFLEVEGAAHYLPAYAGNLDIMTSAALRDRRATRRRVERR